MASTGEVAVDREVLVELHWFAGPWLSNVHCMVILLRAVVRQCMLCSLCPEVSALQHMVYKHSLELEF